MAQWLKAVWPPMPSRAEWKFDDRVCSTQRSLREAGFVTEMFRLLTVEIEQYGGRKATITVDFENELRENKSKP